MENKYFMPDGSIYTEKQVKEYCEEKTCGAAFIEIYPNHFTSISGALDNSLNEFFDKPNVVWFWCEEPED